MTTLDAALSTMIEQAVGRAVERAFAAALPTPAPGEEASPQKKPRASKKPEVVTAATSNVIGTAPLPPPAEAPAQVHPTDVDTDRTRLMALTAKISDGRKLATDLIRQYGPKFDGLSADDRAAVIAALEKLATTETP